MALIDIQSMVDDLVRDDAKRINDNQRDIAIATAVTRYSKDKPHQKVEDVVAPGGNFLPLPASWEPDFSALDTLEYPIGSVPPEIISQQVVSIYAAPSGLSIMVGWALPTNAAVRVSFSIAHQLTSAIDTIPLIDREAVCCLAAASLCDQLASLYSGDSDSTIKADSVNHQSKASEYASRAKALRKRYLDELGIDAKKNVAAGVVVDLDLSNSQGLGARIGGSRLTHRRGGH